MKSDREGYVWVETGSDGSVIRIFRNYASRLASKVPASGEMIYEEAVGAIRHAIFLRSEGFCELGGEPLTEQSGHMHELKHRGLGGEISLANSVFICADCHQYEHRDRSPRFTKKILDI